MDDTLLALAMDSGDERKILYVLTLMNNEIDDVSALSFTVCTISIHVT
jgi:hypothetical protein